jgi:hypothetical protein
MRASDFLVGKEDLVMVILGLRGVETLPYQFALLR